MTKKLYKARHGIKIDGVCAGIADYFGWDATVVRLIWACLVLFGGTGVGLYIICMLLMPRKPMNVDFVEDSQQN